MKDLEGMSGTRADILYAVKRNHSMHANNLSRDTL